MGIVQHVGCEEEEEVRDAAWLIGVLNKYTWACLTAGSWVKMGG
jgi:hypothetical protein